MSTKVLMIVVHGTVAKKIHHIKGLKPIEITDNVEDSLLADLFVLHLLQSAGSQLPLFFIY